MSGFIGPLLPVPAHVSKPPGPLLQANVVIKDARTKADASRSRSKKSKSARPTSKPQPGHGKRTWMVLAGLVGGLAFTGALLKALAPPPLKPDAATTLLAVTQDQSIERIFDTPATIQPGRWRSIYVHQSLTPSGSVDTLSERPGGLADHFVIGNGDAMVDGAIQPGPRWNQQLPAGTVPGVRISGDCLSICVVGNFNHARPSPNQEARLLELITALQRQLNIPADQVELGWEQDQASAAGVGIYFPLAALKAQLPQ